MQHGAAPLAEQAEEEPTWFLISTEFTLYAIRNPEAARVLADHDAKVRAELRQTLSILFGRLAASPPIDLDVAARLLLAIREGGLMQSLVEPAKLPAGTLESAFLAVLLGGSGSPPDR